MTIEPDTEQLAQLSRETSMARAQACLRTLPADLDSRDDKIEAEIVHEHSSAKSKLAKVYRLVAEFAHAARPFVACAKGCSACCRMNVAVTSLEADRLAVVSGKPMAQVRAPVKHASDRFSGVPCPFLVNDACTVYDARPYACRAHHSFDSTSYWCQPERSHEVPLTQPRLGGARAAYLVIAGNTSLGGFADIRDFFPADLSAS